MALDGASTGSSPGTVSLDDRRLQRGRLARTLLPIVCLGLISAAVLGTVLYADWSNRRGVVGLSQDLLAAIQRNIAVQVSAFLDDPAQIAALAQGTVGTGAATARAPQAQAFAASTLRSVPQLANVFFADASGNFLLVSRREGGGIAVKRIRATPPPREVTWTEYDADNREVVRRTDPADTFDPLTRPWYVGARATADVFWTGVYIFFSGRAPGVTAALRGSDPGDVAGVDVQLTALSSFLASLEIGDHGRAMIIDSAGRLIAYPDPQRMLSEVNGELTPVRIDELNDPVLSGAWDRLRIDGPGRRIITIDGERQVVIEAPLRRAGNDWSVVIIAPEADFTGFVQISRRRALLMALGVVGLTGLLSALLVRQGLRLDRTARDLRAESAAVQRQSTAFARLATEAALFDPSNANPPEALTEALAETTGARRSSIWRVVAGGKILRCEDSFEQAIGGHIAGLELTRDEAPQFLAALLNGEEIAVADAANDPRTAMLYQALLEKLGSRSLLMVPIRSGGAVTGALWLEDSALDDETRAFVRALANMLAPRMPAPGVAEVLVVAPAMAGPTPPATTERSLNAELTLRGIDPAGLAAEIYPAVAVMALRLGDPAAMASRAGPELRPLADLVACSLQEIAAGHHIPYLKFLGEEIVAAAGFDAGETNVALRLANFALAVRDACASLFEAGEHGAKFRIGLDYGLAIGGGLGSAPRVFNLWGDAVRSAAEMAASAPPGGIQATEAVYAALRQMFLFRPRGSFYIPRVGEARTFILAG